MFAETDPGSKRRGPLVDLGSDDEEEEAGAGATVGGCGHVPALPLTCSVGSHNADPCIQPRVCVATHAQQEHRKEHRTK